MKSLSNIIVIGVLLTSATAIVISQQPTSSFRQLIDEYISTYKVIEKKTDVPVETVPAVGDDTQSPFEYNQGDWTKYIIDPHYKYTIPGTETLSQEEPYDILSYGSMNLNLKYGKSFFTNNKYKRFDEDKPTSTLIQQGFSPEQTMQLHIEGKAGRRLTLYIDHDSQQRTNTYIMQYKAVEDDEVLREINAGDITIKVNKSKYAVYDDTSSKGMGIDFTIKKGNLQLKAFGSVAKGVSEIERFKGNFSSASITLQEYQYTKATYYQLEPFKRYDNSDTPPTNYYTTITWTSTPAIPSTYTPYPVGIDSSGFELYADEAITQSKSGLLELRKWDDPSIILGYFRRLQQGSDYTINFSTGTIALLKSFKPQAKIFAVYTRNGGSTQTSDPSAITTHPQFPGKICVFIKYGPSIHEDVNFNGTLDPGEDTNNDGTLNLDIYEIRGIYSTGLQNIRAEDVKISFFNNLFPMSQSDIQKLGNFNVDYNSGTITFKLREPFKGLLPAQSQKIIYTESQNQQAFTVSQYKIGIAGYSQSRGFQLKHVNIIPDTVRVKINGIQIAESLYSVDPTSGFFQFTNSGNPVITPETDIEVSYQYLPFEGQAQQFIGGMRADYALNKNINVGGTILYTTQGMASTVPLLGNEPTQTTVIEADSTVEFSPHDISALASNITNSDISVPAMFKGYAEFAKSYHSINTFGKGLIDDFESIYSGLTLSMSEKDWILGSLPAGITQNDRARIYYKFYRDINNPQTLYGLNFTPINVPYSKKPGPYNVATGHIAESIQTEQSQRSLGLNFDFSTGEYISIVTRTLSPKPVDLSTIEYVEIWYRSTGGTGTIDLYCDIGSINEDSDGDGILDSEDSNRNGFLDYDTNRNISEDTGYIFNNPSFPTTVGSGPGLSSTTIGDGVLNTEDLNDNGMLDTGEQYIRIPGLPSPLSVNLADTSWKSIRIYVNKNNPSLYATNPDAFYDILKKIYSIRLILHKATATSGTILIDTIRFVTMHWQVDSIDGISGSNTDKVKLTLIDSFNDTDYAQESFARIKSDVYTSLYGDKSKKELTQTMESALKVTYSAISSATIKRKFHKPMDLRFYRNIHSWINMRSFTPGDILTFRIHSSDSDYLEYSYTPQLLHTWEDIVLSLQCKNTNVQFKKKEGEPDLKRITAITVSVENTTPTNGEFWLNDIYTSDPMTLEDTASWYEGTVKITKPITRTESGTPVLSDITVSYVKKKHGNNFYTIGQPYNDISEDYNQATLTCSVLPYWHTSFDYIQEQSRTDSLNEQVSPTKRGTTNIQQFHFSSTLSPPDTAIPQLNVLYNYENFTNRQAYYQDINTFDNDTSKTTHQATVGLQQSLHDIVGGDLSYRIFLDASFKEDIFKEYSQSLTSGYNTQKKQRQSCSININYQFTHFFISPRIQHVSEEFLTYSGTVTDINPVLSNEISSGFHIPFLYNDTIRFIERLKKYSLALGLQRYKFINPTITYEFSYFENQFKDLLPYDNWLHYGFKRTRSTQGFLSNTLSLPINLQSYFPSIKNCSINYTRSSTLNEINVPYEGESINFYEEKFGAGRYCNASANSIYNLLQYPPWYFFKGRSNYARGRDFVTYTLSSQPVVNQTTFSEYNNYFRLLDNVSFAISWELSPFIIFVNSSLHSVSDRNGVNSPSQQVVTYTLVSSLSCDLMKIFSFGFFRPNRPNLPYHSATALFEYQFNKYLRITSNILINEHTPSIGTTFKWDRSSIATKFGISYRSQQWYEFIPIEEDKRSAKDDIYYYNMTMQPPYTNIDKGYTFSTIYETDVPFIYDFFSIWYTLTALPIFRLEYLMTLNRYNYTYFTSPEPYDLYSISSSLTINMHKNVQGQCIARGILERFRNRETNGINREIISYELGFQFSLLF
ncbi:MAG: hypothetical protein N3F66_00390 [Spirochaetes bacterium]|nr:hypothetical protein [Spirochaetota bacterium]